MSVDHDDYRAAPRAVLDHDEVQSVLSGSFYTPAEPARAEEPRPAPAKPSDRPLHYKVICISMYTEDLARLDAMVEALKARGLTKANRSALIRYALAHVDLDSVPRGL
jgi:hypothetical protein